MKDALAQNHRDTAEPGGDDQKVNARPFRSTEPVSAKRVLACNMHIAR